MRDALRGLALMIEISLRADAPRSIFAVITAAGSMATLPLRAIGLRMVTDGIIEGNTWYSIIAIRPDNGLPQAYLGILVIVGLTALSRLMFWSSFNVRMRLRENTEVYLDAHLMDVTAGISGLEHHERPDYLDKVEMVRAERWALANPFNPISWTIASVCQVASVFILLGGVHPLLLLVPLGGIPSVVATYRSQRAQSKLRESQAESNRLLRHFQDLTTEPAAAKEIRIFGLGDLLLQRRRALFDDLERVRLRLEFRLTAQTLVAWAVFSVCFGWAIAFTADLVTRQLVSVGSVMLVLGLAASVNMQLAILVSNLNWAIRTHSAVTKLLWLRDYAATSRRSAQPAAPAKVPNLLHTGIQFQNISFAYPGTDRPILDQLDLVLPAGSTVAIVGENGVGKTTLVKLLSRFYEPTRGSILVDGVDLQRFPVLEWRRRIAAGFQDFARLQLLARESIGVGDTHSMNRDDAIFSAMDRSAATDLRNALPQVLDTQLGRYFDGGVDLSLGQWQKVALSRAMMREHILLLILDEPTASLDAPTEHALFEHFASAARDYAASSGAITVLVSHRFSTVRMADQILVASGGRIIERGTHAELMQHDGLYAELYGLQASAYR